MFGDRMKNPLVTTTLTLGLIHVVVGGALRLPQGEILVRIFKRRSQHRDFVTINRHVCPPSLCKSFDETNPDHTPRRPRGTGNTVFYQGDIVLDESLEELIYPPQIKVITSQTKLRRKKRATMKKKNRLWKNGVVIYKFDPDISVDAKGAFERAMKHITKRTCIKFRRKRGRDKDFIRFISEPGCWSQIGRVGGVQLVSLGKGCENVGTAVHEITHALGVWHEQARPDRNKYVTILEENISEKFKPDFEVVSKRISTSRGYPYDYSSLMHYSKYAFTRNGEITIRVKGIGRKLGLQIGQRQGLSSIDVAQLRSMYKCNYKKDINETECPKGFKKIGVTCYKFFTEPKAQFGPAVRMCQETNKARLLILETKSEEKRLTRYIDRKHPSVESWRTAGRRINDRMMWYLGPASAKNISRYTNWAKDNPSSYTSVILKRDPRTKKFKWYGEWVGSARQAPKYEHAFICEKPARRPCVPGKYADGRDYRGDLDHTREGNTCMKWTDKYPHNHSLVAEAKEGSRRQGGENEWNGLGYHNKCRNPSSLRRNRPWCYTTKKKIEWEYCDVGICQKTIQDFQETQKRRLRNRSQQRRTTSVPNRKSNSTNRKSPARNTRRRPVRQQVSPRRLSPAPPPPSYVTRKPSASTKTTKRDQDQRTLDASKRLRKEKRRKERRSRRKNRLQIKSKQS